MVDWVQILRDLVKHEGRDSKAFKVSKWVQPLFKTMNMIAPVILDSTPIDRNISGPILGVITHILSITQKAIDFQEGIENALEEMLGKLDFLDEYDTIFPKDFRVRHSLIDVYSVILTFSLDVSHFYVDRTGHRHPTILRIAYPAWKDFREQYNGIYSKYMQCISLVKEAVDLAYKKQSLSYQETVFSLIKNQSDALGKITAVSEKQDDLERETRLSRMS